MALKYTHKLVEVLWLDAETSFGWEEIPDTDLEPVLAVTVGFLVSENEHYMAIASTYSETSCNSRIKIPKSMIQSYRELKTITKSPKQSRLPVSKSPPQKETSEVPSEKKNQKPTEIDPQNQNHSN